MNNLIFIAGVFFFMCMSGLVQAGEQDLTADEKQQIDKLIVFVENSDCLFVRNGDEHSGKDAAKHIKRKYKHYRDDIASPEEFIELSATKSSMSGRYYHIRCEGKQELKSKDWLLDELSSIKAKSG